MVLNINELFQGKSKINVDDAIAYTTIDGQEYGIHNDQKLIDQYWETPENAFFISSETQDDIFITDDNRHQCTTSFQCFNNKIKFYSTYPRRERQEVAIYDNFTEIEYSYISNPVKKGIIAKIVDYSKNSCFVSSGRLSGCFVCNIVLPRLRKAIFFHVGTANESYPLDEQCKDLWNGILLMLNYVIAGINPSLRIVYEKTQTPIEVWELKEKIIRELLINKNMDNVLNVLGYIDINLFHRLLDGENSFYDYGTAYPSGQIRIYQYTLKTQNGMMLCTYKKKACHTYYMINNILIQGGVYKSEFLDVV